MAVQTVFAVVVVVVVADSVCRQFGSADSCCRQLLQTVWQCRQMLQTVWQCRQFVAVVVVVVADSFFLQPP